MNTIYTYIINEIFAWRKLQKKFNHNTSVYMVMVKISKCETIVSSYWFFYHTQIISSSKWLRKLLSFPIIIIIIIIIIFSFQFPENFLVRKKNKEFPLQTHTHTYTVKNLFVFLATTTNDVTKQKKIKESNLKRRRKKKTI